MGEKAMYLEHELTEFMKNANCRKSNENLQPVPADVATAVDAVATPDKFWDGYDPIIDFYLELCGESKINIMKHKMKKLGGMLEKACKNQSCESFFTSSSATGRRFVPVKFPRKYHRFMKKMKKNY